MSINNAGAPAERALQLDAREPLSTTFASRFTGGGAFAQAQLIDSRTVSTALEPVPVAQAPRAVSQSIAAGLIVPQGTTVNLVVAPRSIITANVFVGAHPSFQEMNIDQINTSFLSLPAVSTAVAQSTPLTDAQKGEVTNALRGANIVVDETDPTKTLDRALETLRNAALFTSG